jgi:hypothetical protein
MPVKDGEMAMAPASLVLTGKDLKKHVGQTVSVTGSLAKAAADAMRPDLQTFVVSRSLRSKAPAPPLRGAIGMHAHERLAGCRRRWDGTLRRRAIQRGPLTTILASGRGVDAAILSAAWAPTSSGAPAIRDGNFGVRTGGRVPCVTPLAARWRAAGQGRVFETSRLGCRMSCLESRAPCRALRAVPGCCDSLPPGRCPAAPAQWLPGSRAPGPAQWAVIT